MSQTNLSRRSLLTTAILGVAGLLASERVASGSMRPLEVSAVAGGAGSAGIPGPVVEEFAVWDVVDLDAMDMPPMPLCGIGYFCAHEEPASPFKAGDVVRERGKKRLMTVEGVIDGEVHCVWFEGTSLWKREFPVSIIEKHA